MLTFDSEVPVGVYGKWAIIRVIPAQVSYDGVIQGYEATASVSLPYRSVRIDSLDLDVFSEHTCTIGNGKSGSVALVNLGFAACALYEALGAFGPVTFTGDTLEVFDYLKSRIVPFPGFEQTVIDAVQWKDSGVLDATTRTELGHLAQGVGVL